VSVGAEHPVGAERHDGGAGEHANDKGGELAGRPEGVSALHIPRRAGRCAVVAVPDIAAGGACPHLWLPQVNF